MDLRYEGVVEVVGYHERGLLCRSDNRRGSGSDCLPGEEALVGAIAKLPELEAHPERSDQENDEEDLLITGNHG